MQGHVIIRALVACGRHKQHALRIRRVDLIEQQLREPAAAPAVRENPDVGACLLRGLNDELDGVDRVGKRPGAGAVEEFGRHDAGGPVDACSPDVVIANGADRACDMRPVAVVVPRIAGVRDRVETMRARGTGDRLAPDGDRELRRRRPDVRRQIGVGVVDACIDNGDDVRTRSRRYVPG